MVETDPFLGALLLGEVPGRKDARAGLSHPIQPMSTNATPALEGSGTDGRTETLTAREARALIEYMTVLADVGEARHAPGIYRVVGQNGNTYTVDARGHGRCSCPDAEHRLDDTETCKHQHRVAFATGERAIPVWVDRDAVHPDLGAHVDGPRVAATDGGELIEAGDDGEVLEAPENPVQDGGDDSQDRPDDCQCWDADLTLPCFACYKAGFEEPQCRRLRVTGYATLTSSGTKEKPSVRKSLSNAKT